MFYSMRLVDRSHYITKTARRLLLLLCSSLRDYCKQKAKKERREAPMTAPTAGATAKEALAGPGAGASAASAVVAETAATRTAQAIFPISIGWLSLLLQD